MDSFDLLIIGGGINGTAIARDAAIRRATVLLVEKDDLAGHTSSASSKLVHGGLRYLERGEFRLVREGLKEREILLRIAPHIVRPLRFVLPQLKGLRPRWMLRAGLLLYDLFSLRGSLPRSRGVSPRDAEVRAPLARPVPLLSYWDAWVDDARLVVLNAVAAAELGAEIATRTEFLSATRDDRVWTVRLSDGRTIAAKAIVNAAGPWVAETLPRLGSDSQSKVRLVKGSHVVVPALWQGEHGYILQQPDRRIVFALPFHGRFTLIGTTDTPVARPEDAAITAEEKRYLCEATDRYFARQDAPCDIVWSYSGVRALFDDGASDPSAVTRDYHLELDDARGPKLLSVFGGKITTARALAEEALDRLGLDGRRATDWLSLPGGDLTPAFLDWLNALSAWMPQPLIARLSRAYGTRLRDMIGNAARLSDLGRDFGGGLYETELRYLSTHEFARTGEDVLWRRTKLGLDLSEAEQRAVDVWMRAARR
ncbi:glycerol-3-phosphate dehydrogenase [Sphingosinicella sp. BN140058]|uniref:glycerol-3-phosphate dehydrogenase n=1 Tax=Sphingosinicella sp. BN140058 TaxID=1892855 RepID=UPI0010121A5B|nr:glycerol-3-phosphate dehydrogenase [Sphingosinicella sp. BN140058]QAY75236.1 glycerol-3-phosphate dehydrogenase [Sphingosinicella sp. BN140058]